MCVCAHTHVCVQKYTHVKNSRREVQHHYTRDPLWWLGLFLMALGEVGNFTAYGFAPASLVAPLGTTTVIGQLCFLSIGCHKYQGKAGYCWVSLQRGKGVKLVKVRAVNNLEP